MNLARRRAMLFALGSSALLAGCMTTSQQPANPDGGYCYRDFNSQTKRITLTCMPTPIPSKQVDADAKHFEPNPGKMTVYLVRKYWSDTRNMVQVRSDGVPAIAMVPRSFARWVLPAGDHRLTVAWPGGSAGLDIAGAAGEVVFVEVVGRVGVFSSSYRLERGDAVESRKRAKSLRLVADVG